MGVGFRFVVILSLVCAAVAVTGCHGPAVTFPAGSDSQIAEAAQASAAYDGNGDGRVDFFLFTDADGRVDRIGYGTSGDHVPDEIVPLDAIPFSECRHLMIIVDGFGYDVVKDYYESGHLRMFHAPSRVIAPYPSMTDLCIQDLLGGAPCRAFEALYFDRRTNHLEGGSGDYLKGANEPYNHVLQYRARPIWDAVGYVYPWQVFNKELHDSKRLFDRKQSRDVLAYYVSSAGMGTVEGADGQRRCLERVEQLINQVMYETHGLTKVTLLSDHGHSYTPDRFLDIDGFLESKGWRISERLNGPRDVVTIPFGIVTFASFATQCPPELAADLRELEGVEIASYVAGQDVVVLSADGGRAVISEKDGRFRYQAAEGDPLKLAPVLSTLQADAEGFYDEDELLKATAEHEYPDPLQRLWRAHFALVDNPPDVIVSLADCCNYGKRAFAARVEIASTHGSLNLKNSTAFIMSTVGPLPPLMRSRDVPHAMEKLTGAGWPTKR